MRFLSIMLVAVLAGCAAKPPPLTVVPIPSPSEMASAIEQSQKYLLSYEASHFAHPPAIGSRADVRREAMVVYALLSSGVDANNPLLQPAVTFVLNAPDAAADVRGIRLQILEVLWAQSHDRRLVDRSAADAAALLNQLHSRDALAGLWSAAGDPAGPAAERADPNEMGTDFFTTESAVSGLAAAEELGGEIPDKTSYTIQQRLRAEQCADGGWSDSVPTAASRVVRPAITLANLHSLQILQVYAAERRFLTCTGNASDDAIENALEWVGKHFDQFNTAQEYWTIAQIAAISGHRNFGDVDWVGAITPLVMRQCGVGEPHVRDPIIAESLRLLILNTASAPVAFTKLDYSPNENSYRIHWNERPLDIANLTRWIADQDQATLNWQIATLATPIDELHDAPILYLAGDTNVRYSDADVAKLRQFVIEGGMIVGNADCNSAVFKSSFMKLGRRMFPLYEFRELGRSHLIYTGEDFRKLRGFQPFYGLSNGVREMMLLLPAGDPARYWQADSFIVHAEAFQIASDILQYATDVVGIRPRGDSYIVRPDPAIQTTRTIRLARLMTGDNPDPEPGGWPRLSAILHNNFGVDLQVSAVKPGESLAGFQIVHLTGTTAFHFTPAQRQWLVEFTRGGGTLIIDSAGGSVAFTDSAEKELTAMFGDGAGYRFTWLPPGSPVYTLPAAPIGQVSYRRFVRQAMANDAMTPHIQAVEANGRYVAFFSPFDLSVGLVGEEVDGINGYSPDSATALMRNMILFAAPSR